MSEQVRPDARNMENGRSVLVLVLKVLGILLLAGFVVGIIAVGVLFAACSSAFH